MISSTFLVLVRIFRDCAIIIRRVAEKLDGGGTLSENNVKIGGAQIKITLITGGPQLSFYVMSLCIKF